MDINIKPPTARVLHAVQRYEEARAEVAPFVGDIGFGCDSADEVYECALKKMGHDVGGLAGQPNAARAVFLALKGRRASTRPRLATDAKTVSARNQMFPNANRLIDRF